MFDFNLLQKSDYMCRYINGSLCNDLKLVLFRCIISMVTDVQLAIFANMLGVSLFLLVVLYHYVAVNNPKKLE